MYSNPSIYFYLISDGSGAYDVTTHTSDDEPAEEDGSKKNIKLFHFPKKVRRFKCTVCERAFYQKSNLDEHMLCHTGERPHKCIICEKTYTRSAHLRNHYRNVHGLMESLKVIHGDTRQRPHKCVICEKAYTRSAHLKRHSQSAHNLEIAPVYKHAPNLY